MADTEFRVQCIPDIKFWTRLSDSPAPKGSFPEVMTLGNKMSFLYAPFNALDGYADWNNPERALHYLVPSTPRPIITIGYLISPPGSRTKTRRVFVAFFYGLGQAVLAETHPMTLLHKPLGLRLDSGIVFPDDTFTVSNTVIKGDDAPILIAMTAKNPAISISIHEGPAPVALSPAANGAQGQQETQFLSILNISVCIPHLASLKVNLPVMAIL